MRRLLRRLSTTLLLTTAAAFVALWVRSYRVADRVVAERTHRYALESAEGTLVFVSESAWTSENGGPRRYHPYTELWRFMRETRHGLKSLTGQDHFGVRINADGPVYISNAALQSGITWTSVWLPHWLPAVACIAPTVPGFLARRRARRRVRRRAMGLCATCGYDLRANSGRCSECGSRLA